jgi:hypothetical protein
MENKQNCERAVRNHENEAETNLGDGMQQFWATVETGGIKARQTPSVNFKGPNNALIRYHLSKIKNKTREAPWGVIFSDFIFYSWSQEASSELGSVFVTGQCS